MGYVVSDDWPRFETKIQDRLTSAALFWPFFFKSKKLRARLPF